MHNMSIESAKNRSRSSVNLLRSVMSRMTFEKPINLPSIAHRRDHTTGPETRSVTAHVPALVFGTPQHRRSGQLFSRNVLRPVFRSEKLGAILADNFFFGIAEYVLRADIPVSHNAVGVRHEDGIISNVFDRFPIDVFGSPVRRCGAQLRWSCPLTPLDATVTLATKNHEKHKTLS